MAYKKTKWVDHVLDGEGKVVVQGTPVNALNLNNLEDGVEEALKKEIKPQDIGAAPSGYGLGETGKVLGDTDDLNNVVKNGWYAFPYSTPANTPCHYGWMLVCSMTEIELSQTVYAWDSTNTTFHRTCKNGEWSEWECTSKKYGMSDLTAGSSPLKNGELYYVYE